MDAALTRSTCVYTAIVALPVADAPGTREKGKLSVANDEARSGLPEPVGDGWNQQGGGEQYKFSEPGDTLQGILRRRGNTTINGKEVGRYEIDAGGAEVVILGTTELDRGMAGVVIGYEVFIRFDGVTQTGGGYEMRNFTVFSRRPQRAQGGGNRGG